MPLRTTRLVTFLPTKNLVLPEPLLGKHLTAMVSRGYIAFEVGLPSAPFSAVTKLKCVSQGARKTPAGERALFTESKNSPKQKSRMRGFTILEVVVVVAVIMIVTAISMRANLERRSGRELASAQLTEMKGKSMQAKSRNARYKQSGFTMIEMLIATVVFVVGLVAVAQLVPLSIRLNGANRNDSTSLVFAQRELAVMVGQPITATTFSDPQGVLCPLATLCKLGDAATPKVPVGSAVVMLNNRPMIDFTAAAVANYSFTYKDPNDPFGM